MSAEMDRQIERLGEAIRQAAQEERAMVERIKQLEEVLRLCRRRLELADSVPADSRIFAVIDHALLDRDPKSNEVGE